MTRGDRMSRVDKEFLKDLDGVKIQRIKNDLENKKISTRELTRMFRNTSEYEKSLRELGTIPRRLKNGK